MAPFTAALDVSTGDATKEKHHDDLSDNTDYLQVAADVGHEVATTSASGKHEASKRELQWPNSAYTSTDQNAQKIIFVDLDDQTMVWDFEKFMQQIQMTSWHTELGDPPVHGGFFITEAQDKLVWWNRATGAAYITFAAANMVFSSNLYNDLKFLDGLLYLGTGDGGIYLIDFLRDGVIRFTTSGLQAVTSSTGTDIGARAGSVVVTTMNASPAINDNAVVSVSACRDQGLVDEFERPKHWWVSGSSTAKVSVYNPDDDAIYDNNSAPAINKAHLTAGGYLYRVSGIYYPQMVAPPVMHATVDGFDAGQINQWINTGNDALGLGWGATPTISGVSVLEGASQARVNADVFLFGSDEGLYAVHIDPTDVRYGSGKIRFEADYASPYMKGDIRAAWPLHSTADVSEGGHTLTNNNTVTFNDGGPAGSYADFVAASSMSLELADHADFGGMDELSVGCWFYRDVDSGAAEGLISKYDLGTDDDSFLLQIQSTDQIQFQVDATTEVSTGGPDAALATWYYVVGTYDGTTLKLYLDGELVDSAALAGSVDNSAEKIFIGARSNTDVATDFFDGRIGGAFVTATAMTHREIRAEHQRGRRRDDSTVDTNDTISSNDVDAVAVDPHGHYFAVGYGDEKVDIFDAFGVPIIRDTYPGTAFRDVAIKSMNGGKDVHYAMAGDDQLEFVQPDTELLTA